MQYFTHILNSYSCTNKLQKEILEYLQTMDRKIVEESSISEFKKDVLSTLHCLCTYNPRCKFIHPAFYKDISTGDYLLEFSDGAICSFRIYQSK